MLWAVLAFPVMLFSKRIVLPLVWLPVFMLSLIDALNDMYFFELILGILQKTFPFAISIAGILAFAFIYRLLAVHFRTRLALRSRR